MSRIVDGFIFFNELDLLKIRFDTLYDYVDRFVLVESNSTFRGEPKPYYFQENRKLFEPWLDKVYYVQLDDHVVDWIKDLHIRPWHREKYARDSIGLGFNYSSVDPNDILMVSDVDEIPHPDALSEPFNDVITYSTMNYVYRLNICEGVSHSSKGIKRSALTTPDEIRHQPPTLASKAVGWHFTSMGTAEEISRKFKSFSHWEIDVPAYTDPVKIQDRIDRMIDPLDRPSNYQRVEIDDTYPKYIRENMEYFQKWMA